jgi:hypothetical protein
VSYAEGELTERDYYLIGTLAEARIHYANKVPKQHSAAEVERLVRGGYLKAASVDRPDGT